MSFSVLDGSRPWVCVQRPQESRHRPGREAVADGGFREGHPALSQGAGAEVLGEGEAPGRVGGGSLAAGPAAWPGAPALSRPGRWSGGWAVVAPKL